MKNEKNLRDEMSSCHALYIMPDGSYMGIWLPKNERIDDFTKRFFENWYKFTNEDPEKYGHFNIEEKCPKCGGQLRCKILKKGCAVWCIDSKCGYQRVGDGIEARRHIFERHGKKDGVSFEYVQKTGCKIVLNNHHKK